MPNNGRIRTQECEIHIHPAHGDGDTRRARGYSFHAPHNRRHRGGVALDWGDDVPRLTNHRSDNRVTVRWVVIFRPPCFEFSAADVEQPLIILGILHRNSHAEIACTVSRGGYGSDLFSEVSHSVSPS